MMKKFAIGMTLLLASFGGATVAEAQENVWKYSASVYLFMPETSTSIGSPLGAVNADLSFSDTLKNLDAAIMGAFEASNGKWSFIGDYMITNVEFDRTPATQAISQAGVELQTQIFSGYAAYRIHETPKFSVDLGGGYRWYSTDTDLMLTGAAGNEFTFGVSRNWVNPLIAARVNVSFSDRWSGILFADYGGFESDNQSWQVLMTAGYEINENWLLRGGYRHIEVDHELGGEPYSFKQSGPILGMSYRF